MPLNSRARGLAPFVTAATIACLIVGGAATSAVASGLPLSPATASPATTSPATASPAPTSTVEPTQTATPTATSAPTPTSTAAPTATAAPTSPVVPVTALSSLGLRVPATVYPTRDGYGDTAVIVVQPGTAKSARIAITGSVAIARTGTTVATWKLTSSSTRTIHWNGLVGGKLVPGTCLVTVAAKGSTGASFHRSAKVVVSSKKLVSQTWAKWVDATAVLTESYSGDGKNHCSFAGDVKCSAVKRSDDSGFGTILDGELPVPKAIADSAVFSRPAVRVTMDVDAFSRASSSSVSRWAYGTDDTTTPQLAAVTKGTTMSGWARFNPRSSEAASRTPEVTLVLDTGASIIIDRFKVEYSYKVLK